MDRRFGSFLFIAAAALACGGDLGPTVPDPPPPPPPPPPSPVADVRLSEIVIPSLPSPFYHFEYDAAGKVAFAAYASDLRTYEVHYEGDRISEMRERLSSGFFRDRLTYFYDEAGKVRLVTYSDRTDTPYARILLAYQGDRLVLLERERLIDGIFRLEKRMSFKYYADGNLGVLTDERLPIAGQPGYTFIDRFERYDTGINVDDFSLIHNEFFDHLVLLPGVRLQRGNPAAVTRSGDGSRFHVDWTYTYDDQNRPLAKRGEFVWLTGPDEGRRFQVGSTFSYE